ncbi:MAG TPA: XisI protein [Cyanobacteria bacterium UBA11148]|nr:XisI protein [Cyanobacteria bacterium UBA11148]
MDRVKEYQEIVQKVITDYATSGSYKGDIERQLIFDTVRNHYQILNIGWDNQRRIFGCVLHMDIKNDKIWIQYNGTEVDFAEELVQLGVPRQNIVIGFHTPFMRKLTEYAVG